ncbi:MAG TPA: endolytic transglycosylase MltG [Candidatus Limnocylindrales bacterium]|nr:endolytic transglycosylase MltG [Candidatus Limnocylindrales bacterium]
MMLDDLRTGADSRPPKRKRSAVAFVVVLILIAVIGFAGYQAVRGVSEALRTPDYIGQGTSEKVEVEVKPGWTLAEIADALTRAGVVKSEMAFVQAGEANPEALRIQPGSYQLAKRMSGEAAVRAMLDPKNRVVHGILVREGLITLEIYQLLAGKLGLRVEDLQNAARDPVRLGVPRWWYQRGDGISGEPESLSLEGLLFPATYEFPPNVTAEQALRIMVDKFLTVAGDLDFAQRVERERGISPYEALIAASIVESEVASPGDMGKAARAVYNRVYTDKFDCRCLQLDSAINYHLKLTGQKAKDPNEFGADEISDPNNPYNTHIRPGMPISPISNPGETALRAAMDTPAGDWLYWVTVDKKGTTLFADTYEGHLANIRLACQNGVLTGELC